MVESNQERNDDDKVKKLVSGGAEIAGSALAGALGFFAAGPIGAAVVGAGGVVAVATLKRIGNEASERLLGPREKVRVGGALAIAAERIKGRIDRGDQMRTDGFFENRRNGRTDAEEVAENVLLKSQREAEERKIPYMAFLIANVAFDAGISMQLAHLMVKSAEAMTYRQFCLLKLIALRENFQLRASSYSGQTTFERSLYEVLYECHDLYQRGFINFGGTASLGLTDVHPAAMTLQGVGADIFNQMGLATIPTKDLLEIAKQLSQ